MTRRDFINQSSSSYMALVGLGLLPAAPAFPFALQKGAAEKNKKIIILGAGLAGMTAAYELSKLGYQPQILEARGRAGGRIWTLRNGTTETETGGEKQTCKFDQGLYLNAGAARIPHHHHLSLHYCRELKVPVELFANFNEGAIFYSEGEGKLANKAVRAREIHADVRGHTCELLAKAIDKESLDETLSKDDIEKLAEFLKAEGGLDNQKKYKASERRGYKTKPAYGTVSGDFDETYQLPDIIQSGFFHPAFANVGEYTYHQQPTMLQPVGGMDNLAKALEKQVATAITYRAEVKEIRQTESGVKISYQKDGVAQTLAADYCICTIPLSVLKKIPSDFSPEVQRAIDFIPYMDAGKIGLQFSRRFWEEDDQIFGGITKTNMDITQIFYPSYGFLGQKGVLKGYYNFNERAVKLGNLTLQERLETALEQGGKIHPQYKTTFENGFSLAWQKIPFSMGAWANHTAATRQKYYPHLIKPDGNIYFAGEHTSYLNAWMAGAFTSARAVVEQLHSRIEKG